MINTVMMRSWTEIDLNKIKRNLSIFRQHMIHNKEIMAVVKADAYGHGDVYVARCLSELGVDNFAVSNIKEAVRLREEGIKGEILILGYTPIDMVNYLYEYDITQAVLSEDYAEALYKTGFKVKCHLAIDTGMNRIGLNAQQLDECEHIIRKYYWKMNLTGVFTHLCVADSDDNLSSNFTRIQLQRFENVYQRISDLKIPYIHSLNSAGGLKNFDVRSDFVRLGIVLYGLKPDYQNNLPKGIEPALEWKSVVSMVKDVYEGDYIGYGMTYQATKDIKVATISTGYADGYSRHLSNKGYVLIFGKKAPIVGRICMDQFMVDVTQIDNVEIGTEVILIGKSGDEKITADDMANMIDTIGYEIVCNISKRVDRIYLK